MNKASTNCDQFSTSLEAILEDIDIKATNALNKSVREGVKTGRQEVQANIQANALIRTGGYANSWHYRVDKTGKKPEGHVYSDKPGLPHLLEKGHATIGGGFVPGVEHIASAAEKAFEKTSETLRKSLNNGLK